MSKEIVVMTNGWVIIGDLQAEDVQIEVKNAKVIRVWGTDKGIGQLVDGPTKDTVLDDCGTIIVNQFNLIFRVKVDEKKWRD